MNKETAAVIALELRRASETLLRARPDELTNAVIGTAQAVILGGLSAILTVQIEGVAQ